MNSETIKAKFLWAASEGMSVRYHRRCGASDLFWMSLCELSGQVLYLHHQVEICFQIYWNPFPNVLSTAVHISTIREHTLNILHTINHLAPPTLSKLYNFLWDNCFCLWASLQKHHWIFDFKKLCQPEWKKWNISAEQGNVAFLTHLLSCEMDLEIVFPTKVIIYWTVMNRHLWLGGSTLIRLAVQQQGGHNFLLLCWLLLNTDHLLLFFLQWLNFLLHLQTMRASAESLKELSEIKKIKNRGWCNNSDSLRNQTTLQHWIKYFCAAFCLRFIRH